MKRSVVSDDAMRELRDAWAYEVRAARCPTCGGRLRAIEREKWPVDAFHFQCCTCLDHTFGMVGVGCDERGSNVPQNGERGSVAAKRPRGVM